MRGCWWPNAGNANAFTGESGTSSLPADIVGAAAGPSLATSADQIFVASTGAISLDFDPAPILGGPHSPTLVREAVKPNRLREQASRAIMTTDTFAKVASATARLGGVDVTVSGMAKGAGMIAPDMATMLGFVATDAPVEAAVLQQLLKAEVDRTFNSITVDSDTSTNDTVLDVATGENAASWRFWEQPRLTLRHGCRRPGAFALCAGRGESRGSCRQDRHRTARATTS